MRAMLDEERSQTAMLDDALRTEREALHKLQATLDLERSRARAAADRDAEAIIELRTALEVEREEASAAMAATEAAAREQMQQMQQQKNHALEGFGAVIPAIDPPANGAAVTNASAPPPRPPARTRLPAHLAVPEEQLVRLSHSPGLEDKQLAELIAKLQDELVEERARVDALKSCLEQVTFSQ